MPSSLQSEQSARRASACRSIILRWRWVPVRWVLPGVPEPRKVWLLDGWGEHPGFNAVVWLLLMGFLVHSVVKYRAWVCSFGSIRRVPASFR